MTPATRRMIASLIRTARQCAAQCYRLDNAICRTACPTTLAVLDDSRTWWRGQFARAERALADRYGYELRRMAY